MIFEVFSVLNLACMSVTIWLLWRVLKKESAVPPVIEKAITHTKKVLKSAHGTYIIERKIDPIVNDDESEWAKEVNNKKPDYNYD